MSEGVNKNVTVCFSEKLYILSEVFFNYMK